MIIKKEPKDANYADKSKQGHARDLTDYILYNTENGVTKYVSQRVEYANYINIAATTVGEAQADFIGQTEKSQSNNCTMHLIVSYQTGEKPSPEQVDEMVETVLEESGYGGCMTIYGMHQDTDNYHVHIAVNRHHPELDKTINPLNDIFRMHKAIAKVEKLQGWKPEENALYDYDPDTDKTTRLQHIDTTEGVVQTITSTQRGMEIVKGEKSAMRKVCEDEGIIKSLYEATSWEVLHAMLALMGAEYKLKGGGAVIELSYENGDKAYVKASDIGKKCSLKNMEKRLGSFTANTNTIKPTIKEPAPGVPPEVFQEYQAVKEGDRQTIKEIAVVKDEFTEKKNELQAKKKEWLNIINEYDWTGQEVNINALRMAISQEIAKKLGELSEKEKSYIERIIDKRREGKSLKNYAGRKSADFEAWLHINNRDDIVQAIRAERANSKTVILPIAPEQSDDSVAISKEYFDRYASALGAERFRITALKPLRDKDGTERTLSLIPDKIRPEYDDTGREIDVRVDFRGPAVPTSEQGKSYGYSAKTIRNNMHHIRNYEENQKYNVYYTPLPKPGDSHRYVFIDDLDANQYATLRRDGFEPNIVIQSSPNNYQAIFQINLPEGTTEEYYKDIANDITRGLNQVYGDILLEGAIHAHRSPGFRNLKTKKDGTPKYPNDNEVKLIKADSGECPLLQRYIAEYLPRLANSKSGAKTERSQKKEITRPATNKEQKAIDAGFTTDIRDQSIYRAMYDDALSVLRRNNPGIVPDNSRVDNMIAQRLVGVGYTEEQIRNIIYNGQYVVPRRHDWRDYAIRTAKNAVTSPSTKTFLSKFRHYVNNWRTIINKAIQTAHARKEQAHVHAAAQRPRPVQQPRPAPKPEAPKPDPKPAEGRVSTTSTTNTVGTLKG